MLKVREIKNRWMVVIAAIVLELALGAIYAWSVYTGPLTAAFGTQTLATLPYSIGLASFAVVVVFAGRLKEKIGAQWLIILSAACLGGGYILGGLWINPVWISLTVGLIGGAGIGFAYALPISTGAKWFPDKKGLVTGLGMAGFGAGSLIWMALFNNGFSKIPNNSMNWAFIVFGVLYAMFIMGSYFFLHDPPEGYTVPGWTPPEAVTETGEIVVAEDFTSKEMLRTPQFWFIFITFMVGAGAGLMVIGIAKKWPTEVLTGLGIDAATVSAATFIAASVIYPIFNGLGRISWGWVSDKIGWKWSMLIMNAIQTVFLFLIIIMVRNPVTLSIGMAVLAFNYGGNFSLFPQATDQTFGSKNLSANYGWVFFSYGVGGLLFPLIGGLFADNNIQIWAFILAGILMAGCVALIYLTKKPTKK